MPKINAFLNPSFPIYNKVKNGIFVSDCKGKILFANNSFLKITGQSLPSISKKNIVQLLAEPLPKTWNTKIIRLGKDQVPLIFKSSSGRTKTVFVHVYSLSSGNTTEGFLWIMPNRNIPIEKEKYFIDKNPVLRAIGARQNEIWYIIDIINYRIVFASESVSQLTGWTAKDFMDGGLGFSISITHPGDQEKWLNTHLEALRLRNEHPVIYDQIPMVTFIRFRTTGGKWKRITTHSTVLERNASNKVHYILGYLTDANLDLPALEKKQLKKYEDYIRIIDGKPFVRLDFVKSIERKLVSKEKSEVHKGEVNPLSRRQTDVARLIVEGYSSEEIAEKLYIAKNTINVHRKQLMKKLKVKNLAGLIRKCIELGIC